ncbi:hypothetical protein BDV37DRAFT_15532 [Aspergillus pseudonomiae]|uniref:Uncharacterized protein n=1 Tax=Aspergillus pseudonomiae TaxID=1506151 RepID=A0A5N7CXP4_9EURO|nr:uncharacterized protein BDV37DRAFT_15532 [Aspergillus pseudonomiae]KAE8398962.1 hypothetical protein BDV37DRAFT_15532 [Aspergillus pseudonomiae]
MRCHQQGAPESRQPADVRCNISHVSTLLLSTLDPDGQSPYIWGAHSPCQPLACQMSVLGVVTHSSRCQLTMQPRVSFAITSDHARAAVLTGKKEQRKNLIGVYLSFQGPESCSEDCHTALGQCFQDSSFVWIRLDSYESYRLTSKRLLASYQPRQVHHNNLASQSHISSVTD